MAIPGFLARQFRHPQGMLGRLVQWLMNRGNAKMNARAVECLAVGPSDRVLDLGFGGGLNLPSLCANAGHVVAADPSSGVRERAAAIHRDLVAGGRLEIVDGVAEALPLPDGGIDKVLTANTIYFWPDRPAGFRELRRVLAPGGRLVIAMLPGERMEQTGGFPLDVFRPAHLDAVRDELGAAGFREVAVDRTPGAQWVVITATRSD